MQKKSQSFSNFSQAIHSKGFGIRPDDEWEIKDIYQSMQKHKIIARGNGLSYSDCCVNSNQLVIDTSRLNHILSFDPTTGIAVCQGGVTFADLFLLDPRFIPPVLPGTMHATIAGGIAHDVHGKNNPKAGTLGHHIEWLLLEGSSDSFLCSRLEHTDLFYATIAGLGLTGIIKRVAIRLNKASPYVSTQTEQFPCIESLLQTMQQRCQEYDYQVAWLDLINKPRAILTVANHMVDFHKKQREVRWKHHPTIPKLPFRLIRPYLVKQFNRAYYHHIHPKSQMMPLWRFNNPLDAIHNWNRLYGKQGLIQFQALFDARMALDTLNALFRIIKSHRITPILAVLKYFTESGQGLLSFARPGFTIAIDFIHNAKSREAIQDMNQLITDLGGKIYLAKDLLLTKDQFNSMYQEHATFDLILSKYHSHMRSDLSKRLHIGSSQG